GCGSSDLDLVTLNQTRSTECHNLPLNCMDEAGRHTCSGKFRGLPEVLRSTGFIIILHGARITRRTSRVWGISISTGTNRIIGLSLGDVTKGKKKGKNVK